MAKKKKIEKAYDNLEFLHGRSAQHLQVLTEFIEPEERLRKHGICNTIVCRYLTRCLWSLMCMLLATL